MVKLSQDRFGEAPMKPSPHLKQVKVCFFFFFFSFLKSVENIEIKRISGEYV